MSSQPLPPISSGEFWRTFSEVTLIDRIRDDQIDSLAELASEYGTAMEANVQSALAHLHTSISWTQVTLLAVLAFVFSKDASDNGVLQGVAVAMTWMLLTNFAVRSAKNYINIMRFNLLRLSSLEFPMGMKMFAEQQRERFLRWATEVRNYHVEWDCPLRRHIVLRKVLFEFGFFGAYLVVVGITIRLLLISRPHDYLQLGLALFGVVVALVELGHFLFYSPYLKVIRPDARLENQA